MSTSGRYTRFRQIRDGVNALAEHHDLTLAVADLDHADPLFTEAAHRMQDARAGLPGAQAYDAPTVTGGGSELTQPERLADRIDRTQGDRDLLDTTLNRLWFLVRPDALTTDTDRVLSDITRCCLTLRRLVDAWTPRRPTDKQRASVAAVNDGDWCSHHLAAGYMEPTHRITNMGGTLDVKMPLCNPCVDQVRRNGKLPSAEWMQRQASRGKPDRVKA